MAEPLSMPHVAPPAENWWHAFFDDDYASYGLAHTPPEILDQTIDFLWTTLEMQPGHVLFDQCCGIGRLSLPLSQRGAMIIGVEQSATYVATTQRVADQRGLPCSFHRGDAFEFVAPQPCDAAINWFTSFGYSTDDAVNIRMLHRAFESLKHGGRIALDYLNIPNVFNDFHTGTFDRSAAPGNEGLIILYENTPDFMTGMIESTWTLVRADGRRDLRRVATRMLMPNDLVRMFRQVGFADVRLFGWIDGSPLTRTSRRCIVTARKPEHPPASRSPSP